jgi:hydroxymethylpyrimidine/phosphomethylpyrimidine kinase
MQDTRKYVITIAGLDPSGGAGLLADVKTFEQHRVYGLSVCTAMTLQTENAFYSIRWTPLRDILRDIETLMDTYPVSVIKTSIVPSLEYLFEILQLIKRKDPAMKIVVDPVIRSSSGFDFMAVDDKVKLEKVLRLTYLFTPNAVEAQWLSGEKEPMIAAQSLSKYTNVLLKGGHLQKAIGYCDHLFVNGLDHVVSGSNKKANNKHGSGCVLSAAIVSNLALGMPVEDACHAAKSYTEKFLCSNQSLLGYHHA